jgi:hypothetical protein
MSSFSELVTLIYLNLINKNIARPIKIITRTMMMISCKTKIKKKSWNKLIRKSHIISLKKMKDSWINKLKKWWDSNLPPQVLKEIKSERVIEACRQRHQYLSSDLRLTTIRSIAG